jgi:hypothetical protein
MTDDVPPAGLSGLVAAPAGTAPSDRSLLRRFRSGQPDAAIELYLRYAARLRALADGQTAPDLAPRLDPDDIVQSVFRTFFRRAAKGQYDVSEGEDLWKLFMFIALHKVRSAAAFHRAAKRDVRATATSLADASTDPHLAAPDELALATLRMVTDELLAALPPSMRRASAVRPNEDNAHGTISTAHAGSAGGPHHTRGLRRPLVQCQLLNSEFCP